jgi:hypothetical protein
MKKIFTLAITRCLPLFICMFSQIKVWAADSSLSATDDNSANIFSQPWIWIGAVVVAVAVILVGPHNEGSKEFVVIKKKPVKKGRA